MEFDGKAEVDGDIVFAIILPDSTTNVTTHVKKGTSENTVAKEVVKALKQQAPPKLFHFETDDGEAVYFKKKMGMGVPDFGVELVSRQRRGHQYQGQERLVRRLYAVVAVLAAALLGALIASHWPRKPGPATDSPLVIAAPAVSSAFIATHENGAAPPGPCPTRHGVDTRRRVFHGQYCIQRRAVLSAGRDA